MSNSNQFTHCRKEKSPNWFSLRTTTFGYDPHTDLLLNVIAVPDGRILKSSALDSKLWRDVSCLLKEFFSTSGFDPGPQSNNGFRVIS